MAEAQAAYSQNKGETKQSMPSFAANSGQKQVFINEEELDRDFRNTSHH
jgi:hypothetical protein